MSIQITNFTHLVSSSRDMQKEQVSMNTSEAQLLVNDIVELQNKVIELQDKVISAMEQNNAPITGQMDGGTFGS